MKKHLKRWKPCLATELEQLLGEGVVREKILLCELLDVDELEEMAVVMNDYRIPLPASFTPWLGLPYTGAEGFPRPLCAAKYLKASEVKEAVDAALGSKVLLPPTALPVELCETSVQSAESGVMILGRLERLEKGKAVVTVTSDEETVAVAPEVLCRLPTPEENMAEAAAAAEEAERAAGSQQSAQAIGEAQEEARRASTALVRQQSTEDALAEKAGKMAAEAAEKEADKAAKAAEKEAAKAAAKGAKAAAKAGAKAPPIAAAGTPGGPSVPRPEEVGEEGGRVVQRVEYTASEGFEESELAARRALAERENQKRARKAPKPEPRGMDKYLEASPTITMAEPVQGKKVPVSTSIVEGTQAVVGSRTLPGFDLVRVGNFTEDPSPGAVADVAFFHNRPTIGQLYDEGTYRRQELVKQCCGALRDVSDLIFGFDAAKVTLFYEQGAGSRFVRQKLLFNVWPVEQRRAEKRLADVRTDDFVYAYFYGLLVHKLAHFFDVVHGTRHDFYMTEYRANHYVKWIQLLLARGFDPAQVMKHHREMLVNVVD